MHCLHFNIISLLSSLINTFHSFLKNYRLAFIFIRDIDTNLVTLYYAIICCIHSKFQQNSNTLISNYKCNYSSVCQSIHSVFCVKCKRLRFGLVRCRCHSLYKYQVPGIMPTMVTFTRLSGISET